VSETEGDDEVLVRNGIYEDETTGAYRSVA
jgi:hypothetical protein